jgi:mannose-6-phosphate isomerase-like protein (cupin superfamily)
VEAAGGSSGKAQLDGGCYVCRISALPLKKRGSLRYGPIISPADGAVYQSQFYFEVGPGDSPIVGFEDSHVVLLVTVGNGTITISGRDFEVAPNQGIYVKPKEVFCVGSESPAGMKIFAAVCPQVEGPRWMAEMPSHFDATHPKRVVGIDPSQRQAMADRFFQLLVDKRIGSNVVTQFIGEIPLSKAMPHRHLYEETLVIIRGEGYMWTETKKAPVRAGDAIFLPRKQLHSLQCTDPGGMMVAGVIYPGDNPSISY